MKKSLIALMIISGLILAVSGCAPAADSVLSTSTAAVSDTVTPLAAPASETPSATAPALLGPYSVSNYTIYNGQRDVVYDGTAYYDENLTVWVSGLIDDGSALYFIECAATASGDLICGCDVGVEGTACSLVRIDGDGANRQVLLFVASDGLLIIQPFAERVFFAESEEAHVSVGWVDMDGGDPTMLDLPAEDGGSYCYDAAFTLDDEGLLITARYYNANTQSDTTQVWRVAEDLTVTSAE